MGRKAQETINKIFSLDWAMYIHIITQCLWVKYHYPPPRVRSLLFHLRLLLLLLRWVVESKDRIHLRSQIMSLPVRNSIASVYIFLH